MTSCSVRNIHTSFKPKNCSVLIFSHTPIYLSSSLSLALDSRKQSCGMDETIILNPKNLSNTTEALWSLIPFLLYPQHKGSTRKVPPERKAMKELCILNSKTDLHNYHNSITIQYHYERNSAIHYLELFSSMVRALAL